MSFAFYRGSDELVTFSEVYDLTNLLLNDVFHREFVETSASGATLMNNSGEIVAVIRGSDLVFEESEHGGLWLASGSLDSAVFMDSDGNVSWEVFYSFLSNIESLLPKVDVLVDGEAYSELDQELASLPWSIDFGEATGSLFGSGSGLLGNAPLLTGSSVSVRSRDGDDFLSLGTGEVSVHSGNGNDIIQFDFGFTLDPDNPIFSDFGFINFIDSGFGDDLVAGGRGIDVISDPGGNDVVDGGGGRDTITLSAGDDLVLGGDGNDFISLGFGNDQANGDAGEDQIYGGHGDDKIFGGLDRDQLIGGPGADEFFFFLNAQEIDGDRVHDFGSTDRLVFLGDTALPIFIGDQEFSGVAGEFRAIFTPSLFFRSGNLVEFDIDGDGISDASLSIPGSRPLVAIDDANGVVLVLDDGATSVGESEVINGTNANDIIFGLEGDDEVSGGEGNDVLNGGSGEDSLNGDTLATLSPDSVEGEIYLAFQAVFDRAPDLDGFNAFVTEVRAGRLTQEGVIAEFVTSAEFQQTFGSLDNQSFLEQLFRNVLDREGDANGIAAFTNALNNQDLTRVEVVLEFANSPEFLQLLALPSASFATNVIIHPAEGQVFRIFQAVFDRAPDIGGFTNFVNSIQAGALTAEEITAEFVTSPEFQATYGDLDDTEFVEVLFTNVLPGNMDPQGRIDFTNALETGSLTRAEIVAEFADSQELRNSTADAADAFVRSIFSENVDSLNGGTDSDILFGGRGADIFIFETDSDGEDTIFDFTSGTDVIDLGLNAAFDTFSEIMDAGTQVGLDTIFDFGGGNTLTLVNVVLTDLTELDFGLSDGVGNSKLSEAITAVITPFPQAEAVSDIADFELYDMFG